MSSQNQATTESGIETYPQHPYPRLKAVRTEALARAFESPSVTTLADEDNKPRIQVVVDMQPGFVTIDQAALFESVEAQIVAARARHWPIVFLEYVGKFGPTHSRLLALVKGYEQHFVRLYKNKWSGGAEVAKAVGNWGIAPEFFRVCGVYSDQCVSATSRELAETFPAAVVEVVPLACRSAYQVCRGVELWDWFEFPLADNIHLVPDERIAFAVAS